MTVNSIKQSKAGQRARTTMEDALYVRAYVEDSLSLSEGWTAIQRMWEVRFMAVQQRRIKHREQGEPSPVVSLDAQWQAKEPVWLGWSKLGNEGPRLAGTRTAVHSQTSEWHGCDVRRISLLTEHTPSYLRWRVCRHSKSLWWMPVSLAALVISHCSDKLC